VNYFRRLARIIGVPGMVLSVALMVVGAFVAFIYRGWVDNQDIIDSRNLVLQSVRKFANSTLGLPIKLCS